MGLRLRLAAVCAAVGLSLSGTAVAGATQTAEPPPPVRSGVAPKTPRPDVGAKPVYPTARQREHPTGAERARLLRQARASAGKPVLAEGLPTAVAISPLTTCQKVPESYELYGWVPDHFTFCSAGYWTLTDERCVNGRCQVDVSEFRMTFLGRSIPKTRQIEFLMATDKWVIAPAMIGKALSLGVRCGPLSKSACTRRAPATSTVTRTLSQWQAAGAANQLARWVFNSPERGSSGVNKIAKYIAHAMVQYGNLVYDDLNDFRCDSAKYLANGRGCVFNRVYLNWYGLSVSESTVNEVARHIRDAQKAGHPGSLSSGVPLTYIKESEDIFGRVAANRFATRKACKALTRVGKQDCDEYPFAATAEGAGTGRVSVRMVGQSDNRRAGGRFRGWLSQQRVLHNDNFFVVIRK